MRSSLHQVLEAAGLGYWEWALEPNTVYLSRAWHEMVGLPPSDAHHPLSYWSDRVHRSDLQGVARDVAAFLAGVSPVYENTHRVRHADGTWVWVLERGLVTERDASGRPILLAGTNLDVTRFKEAEVISESVQRMAHIGGWELDVATQKVKWTAETCRIHGVDSGMLITRDVANSFYIPSDRPRIRGLVDRCIEGIPFRGTFRMTDRDGHARWVVVTGEPARDAAGRVHKLRGTFQDVTASHGRTQLLDQMLEVLPVMVFAKDVRHDFRFAAWNRAATEITGLKAEEALGRNDYDFFPQAEADQFRAKDLETLASPEVQTIALEQLTTEDAHVMLRTRKAVIRDEAGEPLYLLGVSEDVTAEHRIKEELLEARTRLSRLIELVPVGIIETDHTGQAVFANRALCEFAGRTLAGCLGHGWIEAVHDDDRARTFALWSSSVYAQREADFAFRFAVANGHHRHVVAHATPIHDSAGALTGFLVTVSDQTERVQAIEHLEHAQRVARLGSWTIDAFTRQMQWSRQTYELFGEPQGQGAPTVERHLATIHPDHRAAWQAHVEACLREGKPFAFRFRATLGGRDAWFDARGEGVLGLDGAVADISGTYQDVTELVAAEARIRIERAKALQSAKLASLGEMSAGIAHEINNPLSVITGTVHALPTFFGDEEKVLHRLARITKATDRIAKIVGGLKKFARSSEGPVRGPQKLTAIAREALALSQVKALRAATTVEFEGAVDAPVFVDEIEIEQVIINLLNNALDAVKDLEKRWVRLSIVDDGETVTLRVRDSGPGIAPEVQERLFEPFFTTKPVGVGTGLGLSIVKGILDDHGASIEVAADDPHTCFVVRFARWGDADAA